MYKMAESMNFKESDILSVEESQFEEEYVYDIEVDNDNHNFFANNILVHNSSYVGGLDNITNYLKVISEGNRLLKLINLSYDKFVEQYGIQSHTIEMEFEKALKVILFTCDTKGNGVKKRYAYKTLWEEGKFIHDNEIHMTGFDAKRSDSAGLTKTVQTRVLIDVLEEKPYEEIYQYLLSEKKKIYNDKTPVEQLAFPVAFKDSLTNYGNVSSPLKGATYANRYLGANLERGGKYLWLPITGAPAGMPQYIEIDYVKTNPITSKKEKAKQIYPLNAITFDDECPKEFKSVVDYNYLEDRIFRMKLENIFKSIGWEWQPIQESRQQSLF